MAMGPDSCTYSKFTGQINNCTNGCSELYAFLTCYSSTVCVSVCLCMCVYTPRFDMQFTHETGVVSNCRGIRTLAMLVIKAHSHAYNEGNWSCLIFA